MGLLAWRVESLQTDAHIIKSRTYKTQKQKYCEWFFLMGIMNVIKLLILHKKLI